MAKRVLSIGNCDYDHSTLSTALRKNFDVEMHAAATAQEARQAVTTGEFDLIMLNRLFDMTGESGIDLIKKLKATVKAPMMLISNYPEYQEEAQAAGAVPGFGKKQVGKAELVKVVEGYLR
ncbi:MAG TPA: response regulator [Gemmatales bacterium]|nr:response regulator [Gemmatales bacterium]